ncbi:bi-domain-containing oxidoreductase [Blastochloris sulfoviridis]|uniref:Zinc-binding dehydrogenase n=1 Tax=Blastochloris sulfoviridis TaxID=50712 RepID=A0A5M6I2Y1_9HYPH|nr:bi-domain-containing oxidoreductase [Blastochloris sulfoviridis]KAA5602532.1 zinc-binding dehydrogenase [Blastochloris sulfoviridis]
MKQILQNLRSGETELAEVPSPAVPAGHLLIRTTRSLVSAGTERMLLDFGRASLIDKARQQPDKVRMVLEKVKTDGLVPTLEAVRSKLDQPLALGYCNVGHVVEVGRGVSGFAVGDRVASNGKHAEIVAVPVNLCAKVPDAVSDDQAAFTVLGAIALQGIRLAQPTLGETFAVTGLGLIGLVAVQLLRAHGCRVLGLDFDPERLALARAFGAETVDLAAGADPVAAAAAITRGHGVDGVIITAATKSSEPVHQAALMCRKRGRIVLVGVTGLELSRADFYEKELTFQVSCSYGPGRYDPAYEQKGLDYPIGFVRWTEQRNFEAVLDMLADGRLDAMALVSHRFAIEEAERAYEIVGGAERSLGVLLSYRDDPEALLETAQARTVVMPAPRVAKGVGRAVSVGVIGAGNYATGVLIPAFKAAGARLKTVASNAGVSGVHAARKFGFEAATTDVESVLADAAVDAVVITTRHDTHAELVVRALQAGKHVFVEKPLALKESEIDAIDAAYRAACARGAAPLLMVGFNRRFAPHVVRMKALLAPLHGPRAMVMTVNAGAIPADHWTQDRQTGGGRIIGEACHFIDLMRHLAGAPITARHLQPMASETGDTATITLGFADGSIGTVNYLANGNKGVAKERLEVFAAGRILQLDNFRALYGFGWSGFRRMKLWRQDKGQGACAKAFLEAIRMGGSAPIAYDELIEVGRTSIGLAQEQ